MNRITSIARKFDLFNLLSFANTIGKAELTNLLKFRRLFISDQITLYVGMKVFISSGFTPYFFKIFSKHTP